MTSRRTVLRSAIGLGAGALGVQAGTRALFSDRELSPHVLQAATVDLQLGWQGTFNGVPLSAMPDPDDDGLQERRTRADFRREDGTADPETIERRYRSQFASDPGRVFEVADVQPGDEGSLRLDCHVFGAPAFLSMAASVPDRLAEVLEVTVWRDADCAGTEPSPGPDEILATGTAGRALDDPQFFGVALDVERTAPRPIDCHTVGVLEYDPGAVGFVTDDGQIGPAVTFTSSDGSHTDVEIQGIGWGAPDDDGTNEATSLDLTTSRPVHEAIVTGPAPDARERFQAPRGTTRFTDLHAPSHPVDGHRQGITRIELRRCTEVDDGLSDVGCDVDARVPCVGIDWRVPRDATLPSERTLNLSVLFGAEQCHHAGETTPTPPGTRTPDGTPTPERTPTPEPTPTPVPPGPGVSFVAFCTGDTALDASDVAYIEGDPLTPTPTGAKLTVRGLLGPEGEVRGVEWTSTVDVGSVVLYSGNSGAVAGGPQGDSGTDTPDGFAAGILNAPGGRSGRVIYDGEQAATTDAAGQSPSSPCPGSGEWIKYEFDDGTIETSAE